MNAVEKFKQYPFVLWALALYLCSLGFNFKYDIPLVILAMSVSYFFMFTDVKFLSAGRHWHVIFFVVTTVILTITSRDIIYSAWAQVQLIPSLLIYIAAVSAVQKPKDQRFIYITIMLMLLITSMVFIWQVVAYEGTDMMLKVKQSHNPLFIVPNDALFLVILAPLALGVAISEKRWVLRLPALLGVVGAGLVSIYIQSRQAAAIYVFSMFMFFFLWRPLWGLLAGLAMLVLVFGIDAILGGGLAHKLFLFPRIYIWRSAWEMFLDSPIVGQGPGLFKHFYYEYLAKAGYTPELVEDRRLMNWAHSLYLEQLAERGIIGIVALLILAGGGLWGLVSRLWNCLFAARPKAWDFVVESPHTTGLIVAYIAFFLGGIAEASLLRLWTATVLFLLTSLAYNDCFLNKKI